MSFVPDSTCERHQKYFDAFSDPKAIDNFATYTTYLTRFIHDNSISFLNDDDLQFFRDLLFESSWKRIHIKYYEDILDRWIKFAFTQSMSVLSKYSDFLGQVSEYYLRDLFYCIFRHHQSHIIVPSLFNVLSPENKVIFVKVGMNYPDIIKQIPKFKTYLLFS